MSYIRFIYFGGYRVQARSPVTLAKSVQSFSDDFSYYVKTRQQSKVEQILNEIHLETSFLEETLQKTFDGKIRHSIITELNRRYCQY